MRERYDDDLGGILMDRHRQVPGKNRKNPLLAEHRAKKSK